MELKQKDAFVVLDKVTKSYKDLVALDHASFDVKQGEIFGYIGPNGAGKTTTLKIIVGLLRDFQGTANIEGHPMPEKVDYVQKILGYLPQNTAFQRWRTVDHALSTFGRLCGMKPPDLEPRIKEVLTLVGLSDVRNKKIVHLSTGMVQKLGLAQAILHKPKLLVLDEPLAQLDPASRFQMKNIVRDLAKTGTTVILSSHILNDVQDLATRIAILARGRIMAIGTLEELKARFPEYEQQLEIVLSRDSGRWKELDSIAGVTSVEQPERNKLLVHLDSSVDIDETLHGVLQGLLALDCRIRGFNLATPNLEEVYLRFVGEGGEDA